MVLLSTYVILEFVVNWKRKIEYLIYALYFLLLGVSLVASVSFLLIIFFIGISILGLIVSVTQKREILEMRYIIIGVIFFVIAFIFWIGDITKIYCPQNLLCINGHTLWHLLTACATFCLYKSLKLKDKL